MGLRYLSRHINQPDQTLVHIRDNSIELVTLDTAGPLVECDHAAETAARRLLHTTHTWERFFLFCFVL
jgi:hypothetical protein